MISKSIFKSVVCKLKGITHLTLFLNCHTVWFFSCSKKASQLKQSLVPWKFVFLLYLWFMLAVQFSRLVVSDSLQPHVLQHTRPPSLLLEFTETHVHWVGDAIQPSHPLSSPSPPSFSLSQHQGLIKLVSPSHQVAKVLEFQLQHQSFQWTLRTDLL